MSRKAKLSVLGLYTYDNSVFDGLIGNLPTYTDDDGVEHFLDGFLLRDNILLECAELEVIYPEPSFCKQAIEAWSKMRAGVWQELYDTMFYVYDPIENYYRRESWDDNFTHGHNRDTDLTHGHKVTMDVEDTTVNSVAGYNGNALGTKDQSVFSNDDTETHSGTDKTSEKNTGTDKDHREGYARGNIGTVSTQAMIEAQRSTVMFNLYETILEEFRERFCILVY